MRLLSSPNFLFLVLFLFISCRRDEGNKTTENTQFIGLNTASDFCSRIEELNPDSIHSSLAQYANELAGKAPDSADYILNCMKHYAEVHQNPQMKAIYQSTQSYVLLWNGLYDSVIGYAEQADQYATNHFDTALITANINALATGYYVNNDLKNAKKQYLRGLEISEINKKKQFLLNQVLFCGNLASLHYNIGEWQEARKYFQRVLLLGDSILKDEELSSKYADFINYVIPQTAYNFFVVSTNDLELGLADSIWKSYHLYEKLQENPVENQKYFIGRSLFHSVQGKFPDSAYSLLIPLVMDSITSDNFISYYGAHLKYLNTRLEKGQKDSIGFARKRVFEGFHLLGSGYPQSISFVSDQLQVALENGIDPIDIELLEKWENECIPEEHNDYTRYHCARLRMTYYLTHQQFDKANKYYQDIINMQDKLLYTLETLRFFDFSTELKNSALKLQTSLKDVELERKKNQNRLLFLSLLLLFAIGVFVVVVIQQKRKQTQLHLNLIESERSKELERQQYLEREHRLGQRSVALSNILLAKADELRMHINAALQRRQQSELQDIKRELEAILDGNQDFGHPEYADVVAEDSYPELEAMFPYLHMGINDKRILVLTMEGYASKDIARFLGISTQHVLNTRSKIKKKITEEEGKETQWKEIKTAYLERRMQMGDS